MNKLDFNAPDHLHLIHTDRTSIHTVKEMRFPSIIDVTGDRAYGTVQISETGHWRQKAASVAMTLTLEM